VRIFKTATHIPRKVGTVIQTTKYFPNMVEQIQDDRRLLFNKNSSGDDIANVNFIFYYDSIVHVEASAYAHWTTS